MTPYPLLWLRYSTFIFLYPLGVASEMTMVWLALPHIRRSHMWSIDLPNAVNFAFDYFLFCLLAVVIYIPGGKWYMMHLKLTLDDAENGAQTCVQVFQCCICTCSVKERRCLASQGPRQPEQTATVIIVGRRNSFWALFVSSICILCHIQHCSGWYVTPT